MHSLTSRLGVLSGVVALAALLAPAAGQAQTLTISSGSATINPSTPNQPPNRAQSGELNADSVVALRAMAKEKNPVIIIDHRVTTLKALNALTAPRIASVKFEEASDADVKFYGDKAKAGILTLTTRAVDTTKAKAKAGAQKPAKGAKVKAGAGTGQATGTFKVEVQQQ